MRVTTCKLIVVAVVVFGIAAPGSANAQAARDSKVWIGGGLGLSPIGTARIQVGNQSSSEDPATAFGISGLVEFRAVSNVSIGFAPTVLFNVKSGGDEASNILDLPLRLAVGGRVAPTVHLYTYFSPGYSIWFPPDGPADFGTPSGLMVGFGGGAGFRVAPRLVVTAELGYQLRWMSGTATTMVGPLTVTGNYDVEHNYLTFGLGIVAGID